MVVTKKNSVHNLKDVSCMKYEVTHMRFVSVDKKMISPHNEWYIGNVLDCAHFSSNLAHGTYCLCSIAQLFRHLG